VRLFEQVQATTRSLRSWREVQQIADGVGGVVTTTVEAVRPDRLRFRSSSGTEGIFIGVNRYQRDGAGPWEVEQLPKPIDYGGPVEYMRGALSVRRGRAFPCEGEPCQIVIWNAAGQTTQGPAATFAGWIGTRTHRVHRLLMVAPAHYMTLDVSGYNAALRIEAPK
jgi:hypothetical protein